MILIYFLYIPVLLYMTDAQINPVSCRRCNRHDSKNPPPEKVSCSEYHCKTFGCCPDHHIIQGANNAVGECDKDDECNPNSACLFHDNGTDKGTCISQSKRNRPRHRPYKRNEFTEYHHTLNQPCEQELHDEHLMKIIPNTNNKMHFWDYWLMCPFDTEKMDEIWIDAIVRKSVISKSFLSDICLATPNIEKCQNSTCVCFSTIVTNPKDKNHIILNFTQEKEGHHCGQTAGNPCAHNVPVLTTHEKDFKGLCTKTGNGEPILEPLVCERDAGCSNQLFKDEVCRLKDWKSCTCRCAQGYNCHDNGNKGVGLHTTVLVYNYAVLIGIYIIIIQCFISIELR